MIRLMTKQIILWIMQTKFYAWLLTDVVPYIRFTTYYTSFRGYKYVQGYKLLKKGDIVLCRDNKKLTTILIGGLFSHAAQCVGIHGKDTDDFEIAEMTHENYCRSYFFDVCKEADRVVIIRCLDYDDAYIEKLITMCISLQNATYDLCFDLGVKALYCSELVYQSDFERRLKVDLTDIAGLGRPYISPTGLFEAKNVEVIFDSDRI